MGIDGLQQQNQINLQKLLKTMKVGQAGKIGASKRIDPKMTMNGSIFDGTANMVSGTTQTQAARRTAFSGTIGNVANANVAKSVSGLSSARHTGSSQPANSKDNGKDLDISNYDFDNLTQVPESELKDLKTQLTTLKDSNAPLYLLNGIKTKLGKVNSEILKRSESFGNKVENDNKNPKPTQTKTEDNESSRDAKNSAVSAKKFASLSKVGANRSSRISTSSVNAQGDIEKDEKSLKKAMQNGNRLISNNEKLIEKESKKIEQIVAENDKEAAEIEALSVKIEGISAKSSSKVSKADTPPDDNSPQQPIDNNDNSSQITDLQAQIGGKSQKISTNSKKIGSSQAKITKFKAQSGKTIRRLSRTAKSYQARISTSTKIIQQNQQENSKIHEIADKTIQVGQVTSTVGSITKHVGQVMQLSAHTMAAGIAFERVGITTQAIGDYTQTAGNLTKSIAFAADGDLRGAFMSAGAAAMTGASAMKNTKAISQTVAKGDALKKATQAAKAAEAQAKEAATKGVSGQAATKVGKEASKVATKEATGQVTNAAGKEAAKQGSAVVVKKFGADDLMELGGQLQQLGAMFPPKQPKQTAGIANRGFSRNISRRRKIA